MKVLLLISTFLFQLPDKVSDTEKVYKPYLKTKTTRYNELVLVVDNEMVCNGNFYQYYTLNPK